MFVYPSRQKSTLARSQPNNASLFLKKSNMATQRPPSGSRLHQSSGNFARFLQSHSGVKLTGLNVRYSVWGEGGAEEEKSIRWGIEKEGARLGEGKREGCCGSGALTSSFSTQSKIPRSKLSKDSKYLDQLSGPIALDEKNMQI